MLRKVLRKRFVKRDILAEINQGMKVRRIIWLIIGLLLLALAFNVFILPLNLVSGVSGIAVMLKETLGLNPSNIILLANILLVIASLIFLDKKNTMQSIIGSILYPVFIQATAWIPQYINLEGLETVVIAVSGAIVSGVGIGMVFKAGYNSGGSDIVKKIVSKYAKVPMGKATIYVEGVIVICGLAVFGWQVFIYSLVVIAITSYLTDKMLIGISDHKTFQIITNKEKEVMNFILNDLSRGVTCLDGHGGYTGDKKKVLLCTVPTRQYFILKEGIMHIDPNAFYIVTDAYEVNGVNGRSKWI